MNDGWGMEHDVDINIANVGFFWFGGFGFWWRWYPFRCLSIRRRDVGCVFWGGVVLLNLYSLCCIIGCNGLYSREGEEGGGGVSVTLWRIVGCNIEYGVGWEIWGEDDLLYGYYFFQAEEKETF